MSIKNCAFLFLIIVFVISTASARAEEPSWLFTVPKSETIKEGHFDIGFIYLDFGIAKNLEIGIHGIKYRFPDTNIAIGASILPIGSPYLVFSPDIGESELHIGVKAQPYIFFAGIEVPISDNMKFIAELNNGPTAGIRIIPQKNLTIDLFMYFYLYEIYNVDYYGYKYRQIKKVEDYSARPWIWIAYSGKFE